MVFRSVQREISLRNPVYPHMLLETLRALFGDGALNEDCRAVLGFTGFEAVNVMEAVRLLSIRELRKRFARMERAGDASLPHILSRERRAVAQSPLEQHIEAVREVLDAVRDLTTNIDGATIIDPDAIAKDTGYERSTVGAVLDAFTLTGLTDLDETLDRFFRGDNPLRTAPIVSDKHGRRMLVHDALALPAVREVIEIKLKAANRKDAYERHRGDWVEKAAIDLLEGVLPRAEVFRAFNYFVPDPNAVTLQTDPNDFTKRVEADGLILIDDVALIIEVKSVALTAEARGGVAQRLRGKLRDIVSSAANQAGRLRDRIITDKRIRLDDGDWIDVSGVREIHTIAVGLEDLSGVTTATAMLIGAGILKRDNIPWTVSIHDLRIVCELLDRPSELLLYLRRRTHPDVTRKFLTVDELDLYLLYLKRGLYVVPDPEQQAEALAWIGEPTTSERRLFAAQHAEVVQSMTRPLDEWYSSRSGETGLTAEKPRLTADSKLLALVDDITATGASGWLSTSTVLLERSAKAQHKFAQTAKNLARKVKQDGHYHSATYVVTDTMGDQSVLIWVCCGRNESVDTIGIDLPGYLAGKKYQVAARRGALMLFDWRGRTLLRLMFNNSELQHDAALERTASQLVPPENMPSTLPPPRGPLRRSNRRR